MITMTISIYIIYTTLLYTGNKMFTVWSCKIVIPLKLSGEMQKKKKNSSKKMSIKFHRLLIRKYNFFYCREFKREFSL